jgi:hypothetical protein
VFPRLLAKQPSGAAASGVRPDSGIDSSRRRASVRLRVSGSATVASGTPLLKATSATRSPRLAASSSSENVSPFTFSTIRSACRE